MVKKRLMGVVVVRGAVDGPGLAVQSLDFRRYLPIGRPEILVEALDRWGVDEISVVDITASREGRLNLDLIRTLSRTCQVPLTYAGGIRSAEDMTAIVQAGADKVMIASAFHRSPAIVGEGATLLGNQCIVVCLDVVRVEDGSLRVFDHLAGRATDDDALAAARAIEEAGAGELFLQFVHRDGSKRGYDLEAARAVAAVITIPLTLAGGVGAVAHLAEGLDVPRVSAVAAANFLSFSEHSVTTAKRLLASRFGKVLRMDTYFDYTDAPFTEEGRVGKRDDAVLRELLFEFHPQEVI